MYSEETRIYYALLVGVVIFTIVILLFFITIIRYQRKKATLYHIMMHEEMGMLEKERARIAKDLHDEIGMTVSAISIFMDSFEFTKKKDILLKQKVNHHIEGMMVKIKNLSYNIMPKILDAHGLGAAIKDLLDILNYSKKIKTTCKCDIPVGVINKNKEMHVYRITEEIINNTLKHAGASTIFCEIKQDGGKLQLLIRDNGKGFNKSQVMKSPGGSGLQNILARVNILKGSIYLHTEVSKGVEYLIEIPI